MVLNSWSLLQPSRYVLITSYPFCRRIVQQRDGTQLLVSITTFTLRPYNFTSLLLPSWTLLVSCALEVHRLAGFCKRGYGPWGLYIAGNFFSDGPTISFQEWFCSTESIRQLPDPTARHCCCSLRSDCVSVWTEIPQTVQRLHHRLDDRIIWVQFPKGAEILLFSTASRPALGIQPISNGNQGSLPGGKAAVTWSWRLTSI
jgi:hypothetical protein